MNHSSIERHNQTRPSRGTRLISIALAAFLIAMAAMTSVVAGVPTSALAQETAPVTASVAPADSLAYIAVDLDPTSEQNVKTTDLLGRLGVGSIEELIGGMSSAATGEDITTGMDLTELLGGELGLAIFDFGADLSAVTGAVEGGLAGDINADPAAAPQPSLAAIISAPDPDAAYTAAETSLENDATARVVNVTDETYEGVTIRVLAGDETTGDSGIALARVGDFIVFGMDASDVEKVIDTEAGRTPALADSDAFTSVLAEMTGDWLVNGYVDGEAIAAGLIADPTSGMDLSGVDLSALRANSGFVIWADDPGFRFDGIVIPTAEGSLPIAANFNAELPAMIPSDAAVFINSYDLGPSGILDTIFMAALSGLTGSVGTDVVATPEASKSPEVLAQEQFAQLEAILGFNVKTDFIDQMVGEWGMAVWGLNADAAATMDPTSVKFLLVSNTQTAATVSDAVSKLSLLLQAGLSGQGAVTTRVLGQDQINVLTIDDGTSPTPIVIEYGVVNRQFVISYNGAIDELVTDGGDSLAQNATYQAALAALPTEYNGQLYVDLSQIVPLVQQATAAASTSVEFQDASEKCAAYSTQAAAQETFDADPSTNWELDQDFDGQACEDYYTQGDVEAATPVAMSDQYNALTAFASVTYQRDNMLGVSAILLIAE